MARSVTSPDMHAIEHALDELGDNLHIAKESTPWTLRHPSRCLVQEWNQRTQEFLCSLVFSLHTHRDACIVADGGHLLACLTGRSQCSVRKSWLLSSAPGTSVIRSFSFVYCTRSKDARKKWKCDLCVSVCCDLCCGLCVYVCVCAFVRVCLRARARVCVCECVCQVLVCETAYVRACVCACTCVRACLRQWCAIIIWRSEF